MIPTTQKVFNPDICPICDNEFVQKPYSTYICKENHKWTFRRGSSSNLKSSDGMSGIRMMTTFIKL